MQSPHSQQQHACTLYWLQFRWKRRWLPLICTIRPALFLCPCPNLACLIESGATQCPYHSTTQPLSIFRTRGVVLQKNTQYSINHEVLLFCFQCAPKGRVPLGIAWYQPQILRSWTWCRRASICAPPSCIAFPTGWTVTHMPNCYYLQAPSLIAGCSRRRRHSTTDPNQSSPQTKWLG